MLLRLNPAVPKVPLPPSVLEPDQLHETSTFNLLQLHIIIFSQAKFDGVLFMEINPEIGTLDLYLPTHNDGPKPVLVFVTGGAWIIGYKAWGALLGRQLAERDVIVACVDYRNFPQGTISDMVKDVSQGISFICNYIADYGGDPER
ncbi:hypothetical protein JRO89_XSUnG0133500 [Xanthoceras sorbifolium]|uniref:protein-S-isoprenylcysteine alpha-carbonyl methylesterase n=1 Tax=Xanthoceras sorbifolium TaxID=99658 RepID=A0ABQ8GY82_9ROSI|nr:hypothetical protein JRO89_XSUnG0133500 [Xanthoceras sorbifolium]